MRLLAGTFRKSLMTAKCQVSHNLAELTAVHLCALQLRAASDRLCAICPHLLGDHTLTGHATLAARGKWQLAVQVGEVVPRIDPLYSSHAQVTDTTGTLATKEPHIPRSHFCITQSGLHHM